jgi:hypothetical protein
MDETPWYVSLLVSWLPLLLLVGLSIWTVRSFTRALRTRDGRSVGQVIDEYGSELKRSNDRLEPLLNECRQRLDELEARAAARPEQR